MNDYLIFAGGGSLFAIHNECNVISKNLTFFFTNKERKKERNKQTDKKRNKETKKQANKQTNK